MKRFLMILSALFLSVFSARAQQINVTGVGKVTVFPNAAEITLSLKFFKSTLKEALTENQKTAIEVLHILKKYVADTNETKVSFISTDREQEYSSVTKKYYFSGFTSDQNIIFTLKDLSQLQAVSEELLKTKIYSIENVSYFNTNAAEFTKQAQSLAVKDAMATTERLASAGNIKLGKIINMITSSSPNSESFNRPESWQRSRGEFNVYSKSVSMTGNGGGVKPTIELIDYSATVSIQTAIQ